MSKITEKIAKLLALASSPYEAEAQAALLKARKLMAEHKLRPEDIDPQENKRVLRELTNVKSTKTTSPWAVHLSGIIASHYCCRTFRNHQKGSRSVTIGFVGLEDDLRACKLAYCYAFDSIMARCSQLKQVYGKLYDQQYVRKMCHSYGWGFCSGLKDAFDAQSQDHQEWGLVMVVPKEVNDAMDRMDFKMVPYAQPTKEKWDRRCAALGYADGQKFTTADRLGSAGAG